MNLRTIACWVLYDPASKSVLEVRQFKYQIDSVYRRDYNDGSVVVKMKGHYVRSSSTTRGSR